MTSQQPVTNNRSRINVSANERVVSTASGVLLTLLAFRLRDMRGLGIGLFGSGLVWRGATGFSALYNLLDINQAVISDTAAVSVPHNQGFRVTESATIYNHTPEELYHVWRNFENLPEFMNNVQSVDVLSDTRSHWMVEAPLGRTVQWDAEIINEVENERIGWRTVEKSRVAHAGSVQFKAAPGNRGTEVRVELEYAPLAGPLGALIARMFGKAPQQQVTEDLYRFKQWMEAGEIATTKGQSSGRKKSEAEQLVPNYRKYEPAPKDAVQVASEDSFPASDPPAYY